MILTAQTARSLRVLLTHVEGIDAATLRRLGSARANTLRLLIGREWAKTIDEKFFITDKGRRVILQWDGKL